MSAILKHAWTLYRQNFFCLTAVMLIIWVPCEIFSSWMDFNVFGEDDFKHSINLQRLLDNFFGIIAISGMFYVLREREEGRTISVAASLGAGFQYWGRMFITRFIIWVGIIFALLLLILPGIYLYIRLVLCEALVVAEEAAGFDAARRSIALTKGKFWLILGWLTVGALAPTLLAIAISVLPIFLPAVDNWIADSICSIVSDIPMVFLYPLVWAVYLRLLNDESIRKGTAETSACLPPTP